MGHGAFVYAFCQAFYMAHPSIDEASCNAYQTKACPSVREPFGLAFSTSLA
jgi:hypothetical protein